MPFVVKNGFLRSFPPLPLTNPKSNLRLTAYGNSKISFVSLRGYDWIQATDKLENPKGGTMVKKVLLGLLTGAIAVAVGMQIAPRELIGTYTVTGTNPSGSGYSGTMILTLEHGTLRASGSIGNGQNFYGIAMLEGDKLALSYGITQKGEEGMSFINLNLYKVKKTDTRIVLDGIWTDGEGIGHERAEQE